MPEGGWETILNEKEKMEITHTPKGAKRRRCQGTIQNRILKHLPRTHKKVKSEKESQGSLRD